ncbi:hypothetical protein BDV12DRAFT_171965 [Aspergillus spectabilis]
MSHKTYRSLDPHGHLSPPFLTVDPSLRSQASSINKRRTKTAVPCSVPCMQEGPSTHPMYVCTYFTIAVTFLVLVAR